MTSTADRSVSRVAENRSMIARQPTVSSAVRYRNRPCRELSTVGETVSAGETVSEGYTAARLEEPADISGDPRRIPPQPHPPRRLSSFGSDGGPGLHVALSASVGGSRDRQQRRRPKSRHTDGSGYADVDLHGPCTGR